MGAHDRRGFLRGLVSLPLIGGGVTLIGAPSAVAEPVTSELLNAYSEWLHTERRLLCREQYPTLGVDAERFVPCNTGAGRYHFGDAAGRWDDPSRQPSSRAALVLSAVGCPWWGDIQ